MRSKYLNENSASYVADDGFSELGGAKKILTFAGDCKEGRLDSASTAYADNDIIQYCGAFNVTNSAGMHDAVKIIVDKVSFVCTTATGAAMTGTVAAGTSANEAVNGAVTGRVELFGADATQLSPEGYDTATSATEANKIDFNSANNLEWCSCGIALPVATKYLYVCTNTAINHATNFTAGRWNLVVEYTIV